MDALVGASVLANSVCADDVNNAGVGTFEAKATPASHAGGIVNCRVCASRPFVVGEEESSAGLVELMVAWVGAG